MCIRDRFWFDKNGKLYRASESDAIDARKYKLEEGKLVKDYNKIVSVGKKKVNSKDYWFTTCLLYTSLR